MTQGTPEDGRKRRKDSTAVRVLLRVFLGLFGGLFSSLLATVWHSFPRLPTETQAAIGILAFGLGAIAVGYAAFAGDPMLRVLAWAIAGAGLGAILLAVVVGGLAVNTVLTPIGMLIVLVGAVLGYRTVPPGSETKGPPIALFEVPAKTKAGLDQLLEDGHITKEVYEHLRALPRRFPISPTVIGVVAAMLCGIPFVPPLGGPALVLSLVGLCATVFYLFKEKGARTAPDIVKISLAILINLFALFFSMSGKHLIDWLES